MDSIVERAEQLAGSELKKVRWALGINGAASVAFGVAILVWPDISLYALVILFGAFSLANGIITLAASFSGPFKSGRGWLALSGILGIAIGVLVFLRTDMSALALLYVIGAYAVAGGVLTIAAAFSLPLDGGDRAALVLSGLIFILFGIVMFAKPGDGALAVLALIAAFALIRGVSELIVAIGWKRLLQYELKRVAAEARPKPAS